MTDVQWQTFRTAKSVAWRTLLILAFVACLCLQVGCDKKDPSVDQKFVNAYTELLIAEQMYGKDSPAARLRRKAVLDSVGYSREDVLKKARVVLDDRVMWVPFQKTDIDRLDTLAEQTKAEPGRKRRKE